MNKAQALNAFWNSFDWPAFDENSVPEKIPNDQGEMVPLTFPYITYSESTDSLGNVVSLSASLWDKSNSWERVSLKEDEIAKTIAEYGHHVIKIDDGYIWLVKGTPFAQRMGDPNDDKVKRIYLNVLGEFLTAY
jgi:hypothetical protein